MPGNWPNLVYLFMTGGEPCKYVDGIPSLSAGRNSIISLINLNKYLLSEGQRNFT